MNRLNTIEDLYNKFQALAALNKVSNESIGIITHVNPDGDGLAVALGIKKLMTFFGVNMDIILSDEGLDKLNYLDVNDNVIKWSENMHYDNLLVIDCHSLDRLGNCEKLIDSAQNILIIDHHVANDVIERASYYIDESVACVGDIVYHLLEADLKKADPETQKYFAEAIYTSILNDTNNFLNQNVDEAVFRISAELLKYGLQTSTIAKKFLYDREYAEMLMIGESLSTLDKHFDSKVLIFHTTREMLDKNNLDDSATSKMTQWVKGIKGVDLIIYYWEKTENSYKFSLRSDNLNVQRLAMNFGGGGHVRAAGFPANGDIKEILAELFRLIEKEIYG